MLFRGKVWFRECRSVKLHIKADVSGVPREAGGRKAKRSISLIVATHKPWTLHPIDRPGFHTLLMLY